ARRLLEREPAGEQGGQRGGVGAACAVRRADGEALHGDLDVAAAVEEMVDRVAVAAGDDRRAGAELDEALGELAARPAADERLRLRQVRGDDGGQREEQLDERVDGVVLQETGARGREQHGVDDERDGMPGEVAGDGLDGAAREEHPGLRRVDAEVGEDGLQLRHHERCGHLVDGRDADRVLGGERDHSGHPVRARGGEGLQIRLDSRAASAVGAGDRQRSRDDCSPLPSPVRTGSGSTGVISAPDGAPRCGHSTRVGAVDVLAWEGLLQGEELAHLATEPPREARFAPLPEELAAGVREAIGVPRLYAHQRAVWDAAARGEHVLVTTGTASGKTLAFNLPVLDALAREPKARALYLYPTKALAQDQLRTLTSYRLKGLRAAIYDGDTPVELRRQVRVASNVILSNPDMLHVGVLPNHDRWGDVLANLRHVVVDEAHVYRGVFGSHVANVLRRLRRLAGIYGASPQLLLASATVSNPGELGLALTGLPVTVVGDDAAPRSERTVVLWNPPLQDPELGLRGSALAEAARLQAAFVERGLRTLTFAKSRKAAELVHRFTAERLGDDAHLSPYRAGYTAAQRREIERRLAGGDLLGVSATNALELGIDVGLLDAVISVGFPGTVASLRQQWGRAGRRGSGLAVLVASEDGLDQFFMREPDKLLGRRVEAAILDHASPRVLAGHVRAAA